MNTTINTMPEYLTRYFENNNLAGPAVLKQVRKDALARFEALGIPTTKHEEWKYTNLAQLSESECHPARDHTLSENDVVNDMIAGKDVVLMVFFFFLFNKRRKWQRCLQFWTFGSGCCTSVDKAKHCSFWR